LCIAGLKNQLRGVLERAGDHIFHMYHEHRRRVPGVFCDITSGSVFAKWQDKARPRGGKWFDGSRVDSTTGKLKIGTTPRLCDWCCIV